MSATATKNGKRRAKEDSDLEEAHKRAKVDVEDSNSAGGSSDESDASSDHEFAVQIIDEGAEIKKKAREGAAAAAKASANETRKSGSAASATEDCTVYVEGIPYTCTENDLREFFRSCGTVLDVRMPRYQDSGKPMGYAHIEFATAAASAAAVAKSGEYMGKRYVTVQPASARTAKQPQQRQVLKRPKNCSTLFVKNLPYDIAEAEVESTFSKYGAIANVRLARWNHTKRLKGFGYVEFKNGKDAEAAARSTVKMNGRTLTMDYDTGAPKRSFRIESGQYYHKVRATDDSGKHQKQRRPRNA